MNGAKEYDHKLFKFYCSFVCMTWLLSVCWACCKIRMKVSLRLKEEEVEITKNDESTRNESDVVEICNHGKSI